MATIKKGLGRGLSALIPEGDMEMLRQVARGDNSQNRAASLSKPLPASKASAKTANGTAARVTQNGNAISATAATSKPDVEDDSVSSAYPSSLIVIDSIEVNPYQPRRYFNESEMEDLANSIREHGVIQSVIVRPLSGENANDTIKYQLIAGERRWRASKLAGLEKIPAIVRPLDDQQALELALIENVQRHDISSIDAALAYQRLASEFKLSQEDIARRVGKSRSAVANTLRLLDLSEEIRQSLEKGDITEGHGRAILLAPGDGARRALFRRLLRDKLSVREVERLAKLSENVIDGRSDSEKTAPKDNSNPSELKRIETALQKRLGARVSIRARARGGRITIEYSSVEELQRVIRSLGN